MVPLKGVKTFSYLCTGFPEPVLKGSLGASPVILKGYNK